MATTKTPARPAAAKKPLPPAPRTPRKRAEAPAPEVDSYLVNLIPPIEVAKSYVSRSIHGVKDVDILSMAQNTGKNVLISGDTGAGKTLFVRAYSSATRQPFVNMAGDGSVTSDEFFGGPTIDVSTGGLRWLDGPVLMVVQHGGVLNVDEINFFKGKVTAPLHGLMDGRGVLTLNKHPFHFMSSKTGKYYIAADDAASCGDVADVRVTGAAYIRRAERLLVVATMNPDYADTAPLNEAFANRFAVKLDWGYDADVESTLIESKKLLEMATKLRDAKATGVISTPVSTNMLMTFEELACMDDLTFSFAAANFLNNFPADERSVVDETLKLFRTSLMAEYGWTDTSR